MPADLSKISPKYLQKTFDSKQDKIRQYFLSDDNSIVLSDHEMELKERYEKVFSLLCNAYSSEQVVNVMKKFGISRAQVFRDIRNATDIFGDVVSTKKEASKYILYEMGMKAWQKAELASDYDGMSKAMANLIKITGVDRDEFDLPDPSKIQPPTQIIQLSLDFLQSQYANIIDDQGKEEINKLIEKINDFIEKSPVSQYLNKFNKIEDVEFQEVSE